MSVVKLERQILSKSQVASASGYQCSKRTLVVLPPMWLMPQGASLSIGHPSPRGSAHKLIQLLSLPVIQIEQKKFPGGIKMHT